MSLCEGYKGQSPSPPDSQSTYVPKTGHRALGPRALKDMGTGLSGPRKQSERRPRKTHKGGPAYASDFLLMPQMSIQPVPVEPIPSLPPGNHGPYSRPGFTHLAGLSSPPWSYGLSTFPEIQVLCSSPKGVFSISKGDRIAQLLLLPDNTREKSAGPEIKKMGSSGNDSAYLVVSLNDRPKLRLKINGKEFEGILDTGADKSIISTHWWPKAWPTTESSHSLQGLGYQSCPTISSIALTWESSEGQQGKFIPYVLPLPVNLWEGILCSIWALFCPMKTPHRRVFS